MSVFADRIGTKAEFAELGALLAGAGKQLAGKAGTSVKVLGWILTLLAAGLSLLVGGGEEAATAIANSAPRTPPMVQPRPGRMLNRQGTLQPDRRRSPGWALPWATG